MKRDYSIDLYKVCGVFLVFVVHILNRGGVIRAVAEHSSQQKGAWLLLAIGYCCVNCFGIATGYLMAEKKVKYARLLELWLQVFFYGEIITLLFSFFAPQYLEKHAFRIATFPVLSVEYWYFTAYVGLFLFIPFLNKMLASMSKQLLALLSCTILFICIYSLSDTDVFGLGKGYSMLWLVILYLVGAILKKVDLEKIPTWVCWLGIFLNTAITFIASFSKEYQDTFYSYTSPFILGNAICLFFLCKKIQWKKEHCWISWLSAASFGVYLLHVQPVFFDFLKDRFAFIAKLSTPWMWVAILVISFVALWLGSFIESLRAKLFRFLKVSQWTQKIAHNPLIRKVETYFE